MRKVFSLQWWWPSAGALTEELDHRNQRDIPGLYDESDEAEDGTGLKILYSPPESVADVDLVFVHGLGGHWKKTWTTQQRQDKPQISWAEDLLPKDIPHARIMTFGYSSRIPSARYMTQRTLYSHSRTLLSQLQENRLQCLAPHRPIIFICHSLGGFIVKSALIHASNSQESFQDIHESVVGILFFGTPHSGNNISDWPEMIKHITKLSLKAPPSLNTLNADSHRLQLQLEQYKTISSDFYTVCFYEAGTSNDSSAKSTSPIVPLQSAVPIELYSSKSRLEICSIFSDHHNMCKFSDANDHGYQAVCKQLDHIYRNSEDLITQRLNQNHVLSSQSALPYTIAFKGMFRVPPKLPSIKVQRFFGRDSELDRLHHFVSSAKYQGVVEVCGVGGVGKTQLALEYFHRYGNRFDSVYWISAGSTESLHRSMINIAEQLKNHYLPDANLQSLESRKMLHDLGLQGLFNDDGFIEISQESILLLRERIREWLSRTGNDNWLLIIDDADEPEIFNINQFFSSRPSGTVIKTNRRSSDLHPNLGSGKPSIELNGLEQPAGLELLRYSCSKSENVSLKSQSLFEELSLVDQLDRLPLAISQAGAYIRHMKVPVGQYLNRLASVNQISSSSSVESDSAILRTWQVSFNAVKRKHEKAGHLLKICALLSDTEILIDEISREASRKEAGSEDAIQQLLGSMDLLRLVQHNSTTSTYSMNSLIGRWIRSEAMLQTTRYDLARSACEIVASTLKSSSRTKLSTSTSFTAEQYYSERKALPYLVACSKYTEFLQPSDIEWDIMGSVCRRQGFFDVAAQFYRLGGIAISNPSDETSLSSPLFDIKQVLSDLRVVERLRGPNHILTLELSYHLASVYHSNGKHPEAEAFLRRTMDARRRIFGPSHPLVLEVAERLGTVLQEQGDYKNAEELYQELYVTFTDNHRSVTIHHLRLLESIAVLKALRGRFDEADKIYEAIIPQMEGIVGPEDPILSKTRENWKAGRTSQRKKKDRLSHMTNKSPYSQEVVFK